MEFADDSLARNTYFDPSHHLPAAKLLPGEYFVTPNKMLLVTVLGSCVAACIRDASNGMGGMNHFMLPDGQSQGRGGAPARYGMFAMEVLINSLLKMGARRQYFEAKVFGGGNVMRSLNHSHVGKRNADFVLEFLEVEKIPVRAQDLEGVYPRKVYYFPHEGRVLVKKLRSVNNTVFEREADYGHRITTLERGGEIELFG
ncbi:MAG TPA: chemoreceptor glutamine deamidase CheD [Burkholderiales bacterium]|nr:chemoreceptor glutamine deamidase CheD [Burkholderiales bacterium]